MIHETVKLWLNFKVKNMVTMKFDWNFLVLQSVAQFFYWFVKQLLKVLLDYQNILDEWSNCLNFQIHFCKYFLKSINSDLSFRNSSVFGSTIKKKAAEYLPLFLRAWYETIFDSSCSFKTFVGFASFALSPSFCTHYDVCRIFIGSSGRLADTNTLAPT